MIGSESDGYRFGVPVGGGTPTKLPSLRTPKPAEEDVELATGSPLPPLLHQQGVVGPVLVQTAVELAQWRLTVPAADVAASLDQLDDVLIICQPKPFSSRELRELTARHS